ncbi:hypothetical protein [Streptosporangium sp. NBC_01756]|uniref:hypothetical protein n=1 Tax=Streptosporangium sp. NBC_01756 TaxID=2975950 RepID=UPI002DDAE1F2|nr:hypothetical protein [Streptosporangium sp. NBC_01756]WSC87963.1 hypothetical protein OIE48_07060 [Streptosporangium sp. NBC_01756]
MRKRSVAFISVGASLLALTVSAPALAAPSADTIVTFEVTEGSLDITAPAGPVDLGSASPGGTITSQLGTVSVSDTRGGATSPWVASVFATDFTVAALTVPFAAVEYWSGDLTASSGGGTFTAGQLTADDAVPLTGTTLTAVTAFTHSGGTGGSTASWNPTLIVSVPITAQVGTYTGTVTHQVA